MLSVAIVDDEPQASDVLEEILNQFAKERGIVLSVDRYYSPVLFLTQYTNRYDLVLLDIEMAEMNGMVMARKLRETDSSIPIVFITNMRQYAIKGYEVNASDFVVKPVSYYDLALKLDRILRQRPRNSPVVAIKTDGIIKYLPLSSIRYVDVINHKLVYHTLDGTFEERGTLKKIEPLFSANHFFKCNNYCLVNLRYVSGMNGYSLYLLNGKEEGEGEEAVVVSRPRKKEFLLALNQYLGIYV